MKKLLCYTLLMLIATLGHAQKVDQQNIWFTYNGDHKLTEKLTANTLVSIRRNDGLANPQQKLGRLLFNYNLVENFKVGAGYDYIVTVPYGEQPLPFNIKEHRIVLQAIAKSSIRKVKVGQLLKYEHRI